MRSSFSRSFLALCMWHWQTRVIFSRAQQVSTIVAVSSATRTCSNPAIFAEAVSWHSLTAFKFCHANMNSQFAFSNTAMWAQLPSSEWRQHLGGDWPKRENGNQQPHQSSLSHLLHHLYDAESEHRYSYLHRTRHKTEQVCHQNGKSLFPPLLTIKPGLQQNKQQDWNGFTTERKMAMERSSHKIIVCLQDSHKHFTSLALVRNKVPRRWKHVHFTLIDRVTKKNEQARSSHRLSRSNPKLISSARLHILEVSSLRKPCPFR